MKVTYTDAELRRMTPSELSEAEDLMANAMRSQPNGEIQDISESIARFEARNGMSSETMRVRLGRGEIAETQEICSWLFDLWLREYLGSDATPAS